MKTGWLSPTGEFVECDVCDHIEAACEIAGERYRADEKLKKSGWVQITRSLMGRKEWHIYYDLYHNLTPEQIRFLRPYFENDEIPMNSIAKMRWEMEL